MSIPVSLRVKGPELFSVTVPSRCSLQEVKDLIQQQTGLLPSVLIRRGTAYPGRIMTEQETTFRNRESVCMVCVQPREERGGTKLPMPEVKVLARGERQEAIRTQLKPFRLEVTCPRVEERKATPTLWMDVPTEIVSEIVLPVQKPAVRKEAPSAKLPARQQPPASPQVAAARPQASSQVSAEQPPASSQIPARPPVPSPPQAPVNPMAPGVAPPVNPISQLAPGVGEQYIQQQMSAVGFPSDPALSNFVMQMMKIPACQSMLKDMIGNPTALKGMMSAVSPMIPGGPQLVDAMFSSPEMTSALQGTSSWMIEELGKQMPFAENPLAAASLGTQVSNAQPEEVARTLREMHAKLRALGFTDEAANVKALLESDGDWDRTLELLRQRNRN